MKSSRQIVYDALYRVCCEGGYSNLSLDQAITESKLDKGQAAFVSALFYGVLESGIQMDWAIQKYLKKPLSSLDREIQIILRMGFYQLVFLNSVPDSAAVDESVRLAAYARKTSAKAFVNAVLRSFLRDKKKIVLPDAAKDPLTYLSIRYSCPKWILSLWEEQYGQETAEKLAEASLGRPPLTVRVNPLKTTPEKLVGYLENRGVRASVHPWMENCLLLEETGGIDRLPQYKQGLFHVQDLSSQICACALEAQPGERLLDICSAPGSKSFTAAQSMENQGEILAFDLYEHKVKLIAEGAKRLGITIIHPAVGDGTVFDPEMPQADRVLCDVPCSGLGIIRRKPEIKYKSPETLEGLPEIQKRILQNASRYVKPGGRLIYSTCTLNRAENEAVISEFLSQNVSFKPLQLSKLFSKIEFRVFSGEIGTTLFPHELGGDGFYIAVMEKENEFSGV